MTPLFSLYSSAVDQLTSLTTSRFPQVLLVTITLTLLTIVLLLLYVVSQRRATKQLLEEAGLPTVFWTPRFWNYIPQDTTNTMLKSTSITRMLPRMERLQGPLGMYGTVYGWNTAVIHVAHPAAAKAILTSQVCGASKSPAYNHFDNFCGRGVFTADGEDWRAKRVAVLHALMRGQGSLEERVLKEAHSAAKELIESMEDCSKDGKSFNVVPLIQHATIGLIFRYITHTEIPKKHIDVGNEQQQPQKALLQRYLEAVTNIRMIILAQSRSIWFLLPRWCYSTFASLYQQEEETMGPIRQFAQLACQMAKEQSPLHQLQMGKSHLVGPMMANNITLDLLQETITLLFAGQDTSAATLSWTLHLLSLHSDIQTRVSQEVRSVLGKAKTSPFVTKAMIQKMPFLDAVIKESMRLYPVAPFVVRKLTRDIDIRLDNNVRLPKTAMACLWIYGMHHHPDFWSQPEEFRPERWLATTTKRDAGISNGAYMPFAVGPRNCLGQPLAQWILRALLARLLHRFEFQDARVLTKEGKSKDAVDIKSEWRQDMQAGFTVLPRGGVHVVASSVLNTEKDETE